MKNIHKKINFFDPQITVKKKLVNEKHEIVLREKNYFVKNFENKLAKL